MLLLMQPRIWLVFWPESAHFWCMSSFSSTSYPQILLSRAALNPFILQPVLTLRVVLAHVQDLALGLVEPHEFHTGRLL